MIERGIVYQGAVIPGTEFVRRRADAWFTPETDPDDVRTRGALTQVQLTGHWTAGHCLTGDDVAAIVVRRMRARLRENGEPMSVSVGFVGGWDGGLWQTCDLALHTVHAGRRFNLAGPGIEWTWPGTAEQGRRLGYDFTPERRRARGRPLLCMPPSPEILASHRRLWLALSTIELPGLRIRTHREHQDAAGSSKVDAAGYLSDACS